MFITQFLNIFPCCSFAKKVSHGALYLSDISCVSPGISNFSIYMYVCAMGTLNLSGIVILYMFS